MNLSAKLYSNIRSNTIIRRVYDKSLPLLLRRKIIDDYMKISYSSLELENKFIYIHVPKTAGKALIRSLYGDHYLGHNKLVAYQQKDIEKYNEFFKFGFVRNPWDRMVSAYFYLKQGGRSKYDAEFAEKYLSKYSSFEEFILDLKNHNVRKKILSWCHFVPQYVWLVDKNGEIGVDYLGKMENINQHFDELKVILNKNNASLEKYNKSKHKNYTEYYNEETKKVVAEVYRKDIELFNYNFK